MKNIDTSFLRAANELEGAVLLAWLCLLCFRERQGGFRHAGAVGFRILGRLYQASPF